MIETVYLVKPRGFCAGVERSIRVVEEALLKFGSPVYVRHAIVHNEHVISDLESKGAVFVEELSDVPPGSVVILSAHGSPPEVTEHAKKIYKVIDATCPLVTKVHLEAKRYFESGYKIVLIGKRGHQEVKGTMGFAPMELVESAEDVSKLKFLSDEKIVCITQTTLSLDDTTDIIQTLQGRYPNLELPPKEDICYATQNRQNAVKELVKHVDRIFVVGSETSSNSLQLVRVAQSSGKEAVLISDKHAIDLKKLSDISSLGITSGASVPDILVSEVVECIKKEYPKICVKEIEVTSEDVHFVLPIELKS